MVSIHLGGSRSLKADHFPLVRDVVLGCLAAGAVIRVGCARGADAAVIRAAIKYPSHLSVFAQFTPGGQGSFSGSDVVAVSSAAQSGANVSYLAGGALSLPLKARLMRRSIAALSGCKAAVFFLAKPFSPGSLAVAAAAATKNIPVYIFGCGFSGSPAALRSAPGGWRESFFSGLPCFEWFPGKSFL